MNIENKRKIQTSYRYKKQNIEENPKNTLEAVVIMGLLVLVLLLCNLNLLNLPFDPAVAIEKAKLNM
ncbi:hypothetical protein QWY14_03430 [Planococcus sp. N028]|uniref:Uncharacterized protein n=1 Tax=Planococcus shixiaomingii TaxID=3058393 RepID=A0ABT8MYW1_9BACL|nr:MULTISPECIES: hypothetical protein [unclassified Planococcus (in: firmicutes)]MDN7240823.1 hypothetical protein [Planococcus sp. N028]WKA53068.1 hypothetical protein QWY21_10365 [Planococcus sp. N022]